MSHKTVAERKARIANAILAGADVVSVACEQGVSKNYVYKVCSQYNTSASKRAREYRQSFTAHKLPVKPYEPSEDFLEAQALLSAGGGFYE